ncbi:hypothetical protein SAMN04515647_0572 [Cohaesibacter sp. ES.047]|nr:hypothetical protein SAMN04515647_0572 [Cohaesibacter sp. ES.047]
MTEKTDRSLVFRVVSNHLSGVTSAVRLWFAAHKNHAKFNSGIDAISKVGLLASHYMV